MFNNYKYGISASKTNRLRNLQKISANHLNLRRILTQNNSKNKNNIYDELSIYHKKTITNRNKDITSSFRKTLIDSENSNSTKIKRKINSLLEDIQTTQDSISIIPTTELKKRINSFQLNLNKNDVKINSYQTKPNSKNRLLIPPNSERQERLIDKWKKIYEDLNNFSSQSSSKEKFTENIKKYNTSNNSNFQIQEPNIYHKKNNSQKEESISTNCDMINLTRKMLEVKISNSFLKKLNSKKKSFDYNKFNDFEREFKIKNKMNFIKRFRFGDNSFKNELNHDKQKEYEDNTIKIMEMMKNRIEKRKNEVVEEIDINIDDDKEIKI
jgi:hypothetical protein